MPLKLLHALDIDHCLLAHTPTEMDSKHNRQNLQFALKFSVLVNNFRASGGILTKLFQSTCREEESTKTVS